MSENAPIQSVDFLSDAANRLFGLPYLFPYQRLVMANILEAAAAQAVPIRWRENESPADMPPAAQETPADENVCDRAAAGRQIVILPTGAGKSLCFQLPAMLMEGVTLVIYPILSLMADQEHRLKQKGFEPIVLRGGQNSGARDAIWKKLAEGQSKIVIANPETLLTHEIKNRLTKMNIVHIVIDEAHCVSEWGESFRPSYLEINSIIKIANPPLVTAFTATASAPVLEKIKKYIFASAETPDAQALQIVGNPDRPNISYAAKGAILRDLAVRDLLLANKRPVIVFCSSRYGTERLAHYLRNELDGMKIDWHGEIRFYHAGLSREEKTAAEKWFMGSDNAVLCATCAYGMGVDKADIRTVIHRDCPPSVEAYLQEAGRAGRDGQQSKAILLWGPEDEKALTRAKSAMERSRLAALLDYARDTARCRRHKLLEMLDYNNAGEVPETECCDVCQDTAADVLREEASLIDFFRKNNRSFTDYEAVRVMAGCETNRLSEGEALQLINYLLKIGRLKKMNYFPWKNKIAGRTGFW